MDNKELDEILASLKSKDNTVNNRIINQEIIAPPQPKITEEKPIDAPIAPPKRENQTPIETPVTPPVNKVSAPTPSILPEPKVDSQAKEEVTKSPLKDRITQKLSTIAASNAKIIAIVMAAVVVIAAVIVGGVRYSQTAYLRPYEQKYGIDYPKGILESFCDQYGKNQKTIGSIEAMEIKGAQYVTSRVMDGYSNLEKGTSITKDQQFKAIRLTDKFANLEDIYSTAEGYKKASQQITFTSLYEKKTYQIIAAFYSNIDPKDDNNYCFNYSFAGDLTEESFVQYRDRIQSRMLYYTEDSLPYINSYLTVSIDSHLMDNYRFVMLCKEVEQTFNKYSRTAVNEKIHYPQNYYDAIGERNPYRFASKWVPTIYVDDEHTVTKKIDK